MLMEGFLLVTAVLEPHLLLRPAAAPESWSPSELLTPGEALLSEKKHQPGLGLMSPGTLKATNVFSVS